MCSTPLVYVKPILLMFQSSLAGTPPLETGPWCASPGGFSWALLVWLFPGSPLSSLPDVRRVKATWKSKLWTLPDFQRVPPKLFALAAPCFLPSGAPCEPTLRMACANTKIIILINYFFKKHLFIVKLEGFMANSSRVSTVTLWLLSNKAWAGQAPFPCLSWTLQKVHPNSLLISCHRAAWGSLET